MYIKYRLSIGFFTRHGFNKCSVSVEPGDS